MKNNLQPEPPEPKWDNANPMESFSRYAVYLHEKAKWMFLKDKTHVELIFAIRPNKEGILLLVRGNRDAFVANLKQMIQNSDIIGIVHIAEAWMHSGNDHITKQIMWGEISVSDLKPEHRTEALTVSVQSRDGQSFAWFDPIKRDEKTGEVSLDKGFRLEKIEGRFGQLFK
jgi:hypothetical protein